VKLLSNNGQLMSLYGVTTNLELAGDCRSLCTQAECAKGIRFLGAHTIACSRGQSGKVVCCV
jgi:hypothetical protein